VRNVANVCLLLAGLVPGSALGQSPPAPALQGLDAQDMAFLTYVAGDDQAELQLWEAAEKSAQSPAVQAFARETARNYKQVEDRLASLMNEYQVGVSAGANRLVAARLTPTSSVDLDNKFVAAQIEHEANDLERFQAEQSKTQNEGVRQFVADAISVLQQNLERARALATSLQSSEPPVGGGLR
jgi:predicted outer membrane protein